MIKAELWLLNSICWIEMKSIQAESFSLVVLFLWLIQIANCVCPFCIRLHLGGISSELQRIECLIRTFLMYKLFPVKFWESLIQFNWPIHTKSLHQSIGRYAKREKLFSNSNFKFNFYSCFKYFFKIWFRSEMNAWSFQQSKPKIVPVFFQKASKHWSFLQANAIYVRHHTQHQIKHDN